MTYKELKSLRRKASREEFKTIESHLHPLPPSINGYKILHRHQGQYIYFSAWKNNETNDTELQIPRITVLIDKHFYNHYMQELKSLINGELNGQTPYN